MGMPLNLVLIRHGESEGNIASHKSKKGDHSAFTGEFMNRHSSQWRLSDKGIMQAQSTGEWIRNNLNFTFDRCYSSEYIRALETAAHLGIEDAQWYAELYLRERNWGDLDRISVKDRNRKYKDSMRERAIDPFYWRPPNGESMADLCQRIDRVLDTLHRECDGKNVIIVCHREVMWTFRVRLERMSQRQFHILDSSRDPRDQIDNCHILHYTRLHPTNVESFPTPYFEWMRSFCPHKDTHEETFSWKQIVRKRYTNEDLLKKVSHIKRIVQ
jgi:NAD+ kinase